MDLTGKCQRHFELTGSVAHKILPSMYVTVETKHAQKVIMEKKKSRDGNLKRQPTHQATGTHDALYCPGRYTGHIPENKEKEV